MNHRARLLIVTSGVLLFASGCGRETTAPAADLPEVRIRTDSASYYLGYTEGVRFDVYIDNISTDTILIARCGGQVQVGNAPADSQTPPCTTQYLCQSKILEGVPLAPGATLKTWAQYAYLTRFRLTAPLYFAGRSVPREWTCCVSRPASDVIEIR